MLKSDENLVIVKGGNYQILAELSQLILKVKKNIGEEIVNGALIDCIAADDQEEFLDNIETDWNKLNSKIIQCKKFQEGE